MARYKGMFERYLEAAERTGDIMLRYIYQKDMMKQNWLSSEEHNRIVQEAADLALSRISGTVDASEVFDAIDGLNEKINSLGRP